MKKDEISKEARIHITNFILEFKSDRSEDILIPYVVSKQRAIRRMRLLIRRPEVRKKVLDILNNHFY